LAFPIEWSTHPQIVDANDTVAPHGFRIADRHTVSG